MAPESSCRALPARPSAEDPRDQKRAFRITAVVTLVDAFHRDTLSAPVTELAEWTEYGTSWSPPPAVACAHAGNCPDSMRESQIVLAREGHLRFVVGDLRPETRAGSWLQFRVYTNRSQPQHQPLAVVRLPSGWMVRFLPQVDDNAWEFAVISDYPPETTVRVYLVPRLPDRDAR